MSAPSTRSRMRRTFMPMRRDQRGGISIVGLIWVGVALTCLMAIDIGHVFWQQREVQRIADMAALAGASSSPDTCSANALANSKLNKLDPDGAADKITTECGNWTPGLGADASTPPQYFQAGRAPFNAARVKISRSVPYLFMIDAGGAAGRTVTASATAAVRNIASFSLGTGLASLSNGVVNQLLTALLGAGNDINLDVGSYKGLLNSKIKLLDLVKVTPGVGNVKELLNTPIMIGDLMVAMVKAINPSDTLSIAALNAILAANIKSAQVLLGDIVKVTTPNPEAAATADINVFELLMVSAQVANGVNAVNLKGGLDLGPIAKVATKLVIVEPPSIAIGEAGKDSSGNWKTRAHSATVRLFLDARVIDTSKLPIIGALLDIQALHLPLYIEGVPGDAWLTEIQCAATRESSVVKIGSQPGIASVCIADGMESQMTNTSKPTSCSTPATISKVKLLSLLSVVEIKATAPLPATVPAESAPILQFDGLIGNGDDIQRTKSNAAGSVLSNAVSELAKGLRLEACILGIICIDESLLKGLLDTLNTAVLTPLLTLLDTIIQPLLGLLGVQLGYSDIHHQSLSCGEAQLVY